jgi:type VI secretion system secreted protein VgrG
MPYTQDNRLIAVETPLGKDALLLQGFTGQEGISRLFNFQLDLLAERPVEPKRMIGQPVTIAVKLAEGKSRYFNGFVSRFAFLGADARFHHYQAEMVPWLWFLTRTSDCRIFQNLSVPEIIEKIFKDLGFKDFKNLVQGVDDKREYCVQYRETDFNFVSRLMEDEGVFYFFEHAADKHVLVLANDPSAHKPCANQPRARFESVGRTLEGDDVVNGWRTERHVRSAKYALRDFNFETPLSRVEASVGTSVNPALGAEFELYDYPGAFLKNPAGDRLVKLRIEEEESPHLVLSGTSTCRDFTSGYKFDLVDYTPAYNGAYVLTRVEHAATVAESYATGTDTDAEEGYSNHFTCIPAKATFRPPRLTPKPTVQGAQTAIVVGKKGEEIWTDKYGRVKVQFHWDREGKYDENSSCWVRVAQNWAGKRWGATFLPRIGHEVLVDFLEGDPDRPIVIGSVYNAEQMPPYDLPAEQTKSTVKSYSTKGGGGFNELRIQDKKGEEQLFLSAERQQDVRVKKDSLEWVGGDRHLIVVNNQLEQVKGDKHLHVKGDQNEKIDGTLSHECGMDSQTKCGLNYALDAGQEIHLKTNLNLVVESGVTLTAQVGGNFININPVGIFIQGTALMLNSGGSAGSGGGVKVQAPQDPKEAGEDEPGEQAALPSQTPGVVSPQAMALIKAARTGAPFCEKCAEAAYAAAIARGASEEEARAEAERAGRAGAAAEGGPAGAEPSEAQLQQQARGPAEPGAGPVAPLTAPMPAREEPAGEEEAPAEEKTFIEVEVVDEDGKPLSDEEYLLVLPDGSKKTGKLDASGKLRFENIDPGECQISFPKLKGVNFSSK